MSSHPPMAEKARRFLNEASQIWESIPTPIYDELRGVVSGKSMSEAQSIFNQYVTKLKGAYPKCKVYTDPRGPGEHPGNTFQRFESSMGENYYRQFQRAERACQINQLYNRKIGKKKQLVRGRYIYVNNEVPEIQTAAELGFFLQKKNQLELENEARKAEQKRKEEERRFAAVKQGNLLGLSTPPEPNLLQFGPTKEGLKNRENQLKNLFGGKKTRKNRKSRKTRKTNRK